MEDTKQKPLSKINIDYLVGHLKANQWTERARLSSFVDPRYAHHNPVFSMMTIDTMLRDPKIRFGLSLIKGPIASYTKFFTEEESKSPDITQAIIELDYHFPYAVFCKNQEQADFIISQLNRFWEVGIFKAMRAVEWGYSGSQVLYRRNSKGQLTFDNLHPYRAPHLQPVVQKNGIIGFVRITNNNGYVPLGKGFWHLHAREQDYFFGESRLLGAYVPWHEKWMMGGARDIRRTWFFRNAYDGGEIYYPEGSFQDDSGTSYSNEQLALQMSEMHQTGSTMVFPSTKGLDGKRDWEYVPAKANNTPQGLMEYHEFLGDESLEGMGIPTEIFKSKSQGLGAATGRMVPLMAFIASLTPIGSDLIQDFRCQILDPILLRANNFKDDYEIKRIVPKNVDAALKDDKQKQMQSKTLKTVEDSGM